MKSVLARQDDGTIQLTITIPQDNVKKVREEVIEHAVSSTELPGFRKGKAPQKLVEEKLDQAKVKEEILKKLLPQAYLEAVQEHGIRPIINPQIHVEKLEDDKEWEFKATTCEIPAIDLKEYKDAVKNLTAKSKIAVPGKESQPASFDEIVKAVVDHVDAQIPQILVDQEVDRLLSQMLDEIKRLGLNLDQYLATTGKTPEQLRTDYAQKARNDIKLEFALQKIAEAEKIAVEEKEIDEAIQKAKDPEEQKNLQNNRYLLANILRQQKTLDFLKNL